MDHLGVAMIAVVAMTALMGTQAQEDKSYVEGNNSTSASLPPAGRRGHDLLPSRCGIMLLTDGLVNTRGEDASLFDWPWLALLRGKVRKQLSNWFCGGALINDRYVLTAGHCLQDTEIEFVRLGEHTLSKDPDCRRDVCAPSPQDIPVEQIIVHPEYKSPCNMCNDIGLLRLSHPAQLDLVHVMPICVPVDPLNDMGFPEDEFQGKFAWTAGWSQTPTSADFQTQLSDILQQVLLPIREGTSCSRLKTGYPDPRMVICAGGEDGKDSCHGDGGGPLMVSNKIETRRFVVGIISAGPRLCGIPGAQTLYTNIHYYAPWILQNLRP